MSIESQGFYFAVVALGGQFLAIEFEIERAHIASLDDDFFFRTNRFLRRGSQQSPSDDFAVDGNR